MGTPWGFSIEIERATVWEDHAMDVLDLVELTEEDGGVVMTTDAFLDLLAESFAPGHWVVRVERA